ncbi:hypothetical protein Hanom_Chr15g01366711 [Helianthus anomalus]
MAVQCKYLLCCFIWCFESWKYGLESDAWIWKIMFLFPLLRQCFALFWTCYVI